MTVAFISAIGHQKRTTTQKVIPIFRWGGRLIRRHCLVCISQSVVHLKLRIILTFCLYIKFLSYTVTINKNVYTRKSTCSRARSELSVLLWTQRSPEVYLVRKKKPDQKYYFSWRNLIVFF